MTASPTPGSHADIRQELGGTYSITVTPSVEKFPTPTYSVRIDWTCDPGQVQTLVDRVFREIEFVKTQPFRPEGMAGLRQTLLREFDERRQDNGYLISQIARRYQDGEGANIGAVERVPQQIAALTADAIQSAAVLYLDKSRYVRVTLMPEGR